MAWRPFGNGTKTTSPSMMISSRCRRMRRWMPRRLDARRTIPLHALELKKDRDGINPRSKICDKEYALASLGQAEPLSVENPPNNPPTRPGNHTVIRPPFVSSRVRDGISSADKRSQEAAEGVVAVFVVLDVEDSRYVLPNDRDAALLVLEFMSECRICESEVAARIGQ